MKTLIEIVTDEGDLVLDYHLGSGTTCAVAHKLKRRYIGIEQMDYLNTLTVPRLQKVIAGDEVGISKTVKWSGGGSFVYCELLNHTEAFVKAVMNYIGHNKGEQEFLKYAGLMMKYNINIDELKKVDKAELRTHILYLIDKNMLYVPLSEIENKDYAIDKKTITLNQKLYHP